MREPKPISPEVSPVRAPRHVGVREAAVVCGLLGIAAIGLATGVVACFGRGAHGISVAASVVIQAPVPVAEPIAVVIGEDPKLPAMPEAVASPRIVVAMAEVPVVADLAEAPAPKEVVVIEPPAEVPLTVVKDEPKPTPANRLWRNGRVPGQDGITKRIDKRSEADVIKELQKVGETSLVKPNEQRDKFLAEVVKQTKNNPKTVGALAVTKGRSDLAGLPFRFGTDAVMNPDKAKELDAMAKAVRTAALGRQPAERKENARFGVSPTDWVLGTVGSENPVWSDEVAVSCVQQMFQSSDMDTRLQASQALTRVRSPETTATLTKWAVFDPSDRVRAAAITALAERDRAEVQAHLLTLLRYPWPRAVEHACEAIVELGLTEAVPSLAMALDSADPEAEFSAPLPGGGSARFRRVMTKVNHVRNCLLCHPASDRQAVLAGTDPDESLLEKLSNPSFEQYYEVPSSRSVTAAATFLKQDFSAILPGKQHARTRRYDYFVAVRRADELPVSDRGINNPYKAAIRFALRELAGELANDKSWLATQKKLAPLVPDRNRADVARAVGMKTDPETYATLQAESPGGKWTGLDLTKTALADHLQASQTGSQETPIQVAIAQQSKKVALVAHLESQMDTLNAAAKFRAEKLIALARDPQYTGVPLATILMLPEKPGQK